MEFFAAVRSVDERMITVSGNYAKLEIFKVNLPVVWVVWEFGKHCGIDFGPTLAGRGGEFFDEAIKGGEVGI